MIVALDDAPDVVAVVPTLGGDLPRLEACLRSVLTSRTTARLAVAVVWNDPRRPVPRDAATGAPDGLAEILRGVTVLEPGLNLGFPGGLAHARSRTDARLLWLVQDDVRAAPDCLDRLVARLDEPDAPAMASPVVVDADGIVPAGSRGGTFDADGGLAGWAPVAPARPEDLDVTVDWVSSSGSVVRTDAWDEVGGYDPAFFPLLWSDVDFGRRLLAAGLRSVLAPAALVEHDRNGSTPRLLGEHLAQVQRARFDRKRRGEEPVAAPDGLDPALLASVARSATLGYLDLARFASRRVAETEAALAATEAALAERAEVLAARDEALAGLTAELTRRTDEADTLVVEADAARDEAEAARAEAARLAAALEAARGEAEGLRGELARTRATVSWRLTAPLRALRAVGGEARRRR